MSQIFYYNDGCLILTRFKFSFYTTPILLLNTTDYITMVQFLLVTQCVV